ncbi:MAG TPA: OmpA family protein [Myxococcota bacterium]|jgi:outer membrane protein OmpA-like peptidoglycan-associated protein
MKRSLVFSLIAGFAVACVGPPGPTGPQGPTGMTGMTGAQGPAGMTGSTGQRGMTGSTGQAGYSAAQAQPATLAGWVSLRDIYFDYDKAEVRLSEMNKISDIAAYVNQNPTVRIGVDGSTDLLRGTNQYNSSLRDRRVANVRDALMQAGVSSDRIESGGFAAERTKCSDSVERCSQREGRVEVLAHSPS